MIAPQAVHIAGVPEQLREIPQWVLWNNEPHPTKPRGNKVPKYSSCGRLVNGSSTDHLTWDTFDGVCEGLNKFNTSGIGFVLTKSTGIFCVDIDECVTEDGISEFALGVLDTFGDRTYIELSFHNDGLHIFGLGNLPENERGGKRKGIEVYDSGRFIAITGRKLKTSSPTISDCSRELATILKQFPKAKREQPRPTPLIPNGSRIQDKYGLSCITIGYPNNAEVRNGRVIGSHPLHGSSTGSNFHIETHRNVWRCFRCESGGGALELYAVMKGIIDCEDAQPRCLDGRWREIFDALERDGYKPDPLKFPMNIFDKRRNTRDKLIALGVLNVSD